MLCRILLCGCNCTESIRHQVDWGQGCLSTCLPFTFQFVCGLDEFRFPQISGSWQAGLSTAGMHSGPLLKLRGL